MEKTQNHQIPRAKKSRILPKNRGKKKKKKKKKPPKTPKGPSSVEDIKVKMQASLGKSTMNSPGKLRQGERKRKDEYKGESKLSLISNPDEVFYFNLNPRS